MRYGQIRKYDVSNGLGVRTTLFVVGCNFFCKGCFNEEYQNFASGHLWTQAQEDLVLQHLSDSNVDGFSLLGGEVFHQLDLQPLIKLLTRIRAEHPSKDIWIWSGFLYEDLVKDENKVKLLSLCDVLVDGRFIESEKDLTLKFRGSKSQRIIDVQESLKQNKVVLYNC